MNFVHDLLASGRKRQILTVADVYARFSPIVDPRFSYRGEDVVQALERVCNEVGYPKAIRVDQGLEFVSRDLDLWAYQDDVVLDSSRPGKPTDNAFIEAFNGLLRAECLNTHWFVRMADPREKLEAWGRDFNEIRPHGAIGNNVPVSRHVFDEGDAGAPTPQKGRNIYSPAGARWGSVQAQSIGQNWSRLADAHHMSAKHEISCLAPGCVTAPW